MRRQLSLYVMASLLLLIGGPASVLGQVPGLKLYISADMEGVVGAVTGDQLGPGGHSPRL